MGGNPVVAIIGAIVLAAAVGVQVETKQATGKLVGKATVATYLVGALLLAAGLGLFSQVFDGGGGAGKPSVAGATGAGPTTGAAPANPATSGSGGSGVTTATSQTAPQSGNGGGVVGGVVGGGAGGVVGGGSGGPAPGHSSAQNHPTSAAPPPSTPPAAAVFSRGSLTYDGNPEDPYDLDFATPVHYGDVNTITMVSGEIDVVVPNGAHAAPAWTASSLPGRQQCLDALGQAPGGYPGQYQNPAVGTTFCFRTAGGRYGAIRVTDAAAHYTIEYVVWS